MGNDMTYCWNRITRKIRLVMVLSAGVALAAILSGCGRNSEAASSVPDATLEMSSSSLQRAGTPILDAAGRGRQLFIRACAGCHGPQGQGIPHLGSDLQTSKFLVGLSDDQLVAFITQGRAVNDSLNTTHVAMPPKGGNPALTTQDLRDIVAYLRQLQQQVGTAQ